MYCVAWTGNNIARPFNSPDVPTTIVYHTWNISGGGYEISAVLYMGVCGVEFQMREYGVSSIKDIE